MTTALEISPVATYAWSLLGDPINELAVTGQMTLKGLLDWQNQNNLSFELVKRLVINSDHESNSDLIKLKSVVQFVGGREKALELFDRLETLSRWIGEAAQQSKFNVESE